MEPVANGLVGVYKSMNAMSFPLFSVGGMACYFGRICDFLLQIRFLFFIMHPLCRKIVSLIFKRDVVKYFLYFAPYYAWLKREQFPKIIVSRV